MVISVFTIHQDVLVRRKSCFIPCSLETPILTRTPMMRAAGQLGEISNGEKLGEKLKGICMTISFGCFFDPCDEPTTHVKALI